MSDTSNSKPDMVRMHADDVTPPSNEDLRRLASITNEQIDRAAREDPDSPDPDWIPGKGPRYEPRTIRIAEDLLPWLDQHPKRDSLINALLRAYRDERDAVADELEVIAGRLRTHHKEAS